jgi:hypothetical protein
MRSGRANPDVCPIERKTGGKGPPVQNTAYIESLSGNRLFHDRAIFGDFDALRQTLPHVLDEGIGNFKQFGPEFGVASGFFDCIDQTNHGDGEFQFAES